MNSTAIRKRSSVNMIPLTAEPSDLPSGRSRLALRSGWATATLSWQIAPWRWWRTRPMKGTPMTLMIILGAAAALYGLLQLFRCALHALPVFVGLSIGLQPLQRSAALQPSLSPLRASAASFVRWECHGRSRLRRNCGVEPLRARSPVADDEPAPAVSILAIRSRRPSNRVRGCRNTCRALHAG